MRTDDFDFDLPPDRIAQTPPAERGASRLMVLGRESGATHVSVMADLATWLRPGDLLVVNDSRVFPARLIGRREPGGGRVECLLIARLDAQHWHALVHPGQRLRTGARMTFEGASHRLVGDVVSQDAFGRRVIRLSSASQTGCDDETTAAIDAIGHMPLPPYIRRADAAEDRDRYQTIFARDRGSVAAPTAGLHFTPGLLDALRARDIHHVAITLHVGYGTFKPVRVDDVRDHVVDPEPFSVSPAAADQIARARREGRRIVAVGTTTTRALESAAATHGGQVPSGDGSADAFIYPGYAFRVVDALLTNFHVPRSSLLLLVSAFAGRERVLAAYRRAIDEGFRFYSYGDAMLVE